MMVAMAKSISRVASAKLLVSARSTPRRQPTEEPSAAWGRRVEQLEKAYNDLVLHHPHMGAPAIVDAAMVAQIAIGALIGDESVPRRFEQVSLMARAVATTTRARLAELVVHGARNQEQLRLAESRRPLARAFLASAKADLRYLGASKDPMRLDADAVVALLARYRAKPNTARRQVSAEGVIDELLFMCGAPTKKAARAQRRRRVD